LLLCVAGVVLGFVLTSIAIHFILRAFPGMPVTIPTGWRVGAAAMAIAGGGLGALYPAVKAARFDPIKALGYE
jgi:putative ABC transport system permease protein